MNDCVVQKMELQGWLSQHLWTPWGLLKVHNLQWLLKVHHELLFLKRGSRGSASKGGCKEKNGRKSYWFFFCEAKPCACLTGHQMRTTSQHNPCHVICSCLVLISHMKLAVQEFCTSPQSAMPHSKSRSYVWTLFKASMTLLLFHRFPQFLAADPTVLSVPEGGRQRYPLSISSYSLHAGTPKDNPITLQHHEQNRGGRRRGAPPFSIDLLVF